MLKATGAALAVLLLAIALLSACKPTAQVTYNKGMALLEAQKYQEALVEFDKVLAELPDNKSALFRKAICTYQLKRYPEAEKLFERFLAATEHERDTFKDERFDAEFYRDKSIQAQGQTVAQDPSQIPPPPMGE